MSKAGFILYGAKGKIGNIVAQGGKAGSILREKVDPTNANTKGQVRQRARFIDAVRFYQHSNTNFYKMAFNDKKSSESDFNAFMRQNVKNAVCITKTMADDAQFPALGNFIASKGSKLNPAQTSYSNGYFTLAVDGLENDATTIGELSAALISAYGISEGDFVTLVKIDTSLVSIDSDSLLPAYTDSKIPQWSIKQFAVNSTSVATITETLGLDYTVADSTLKLRDPNTKTVSAFFVSFSRNTDSGVLASQTSIVYNTIGQNIIAMMSLDSFQEKVLSDWGYNDSAILQGAAVETTKLSVVLAASPINAGTVVGSGNYVSGTQVELVAVPVDGYTFKQWSDGNTENPRTITVTEALSLTAEFELAKYKLELECDPAEGGTVEGEGTYTAGTVATIKATAATGYMFTGWNDSNMYAERQITMNADTTLVATFVSTSD